MQPWLKQMLFAALAIFATWILVIVYWRNNMYMPSTSDTVTYLVIMPFTLLISAYIIKRSGQGLLALTAVTKTRLNEKTENTYVQQTKTAETADTWTVFIISCATRTRFGESASDILDAIENKATKFELDPELTDPNGYPILSGRIEDLDTSVAIALFKQFTVKLKLSDQPWHPEDLRTITLAHNVCLDLALSIISSSCLSETLNNPGKSGTAITMPMIYLASCLPASWREQQKQQVTLWLIDLLVTQGLPGDFILPHPLNTLNLDNPVHLIDKINILINQQNESGLHLIISSYSFIGEHSMMASTMANTRNITRTIPGEAAAGLIITDLTWAQKMTLAVTVKAHRVAQLDRDTFADDGGKTKPDILIKAIETAIKTANIEISAVKSMTSDTDDRPTRITELYEALNIALPEIDLTANCFPIAAHCGTIGAVSSLIAIISAADLAKKSEHAVLSACNNDRLTRSAIIINYLQTD